ncbi:MAG: ATP-binding protein [Nitrospiria bacterium]
MILSFVLVLITGGFAFLFFNGSENPGTFVLFLLSVSVLGLLISGLFGWVVANRFVATFRQMTQSVEQVSEGTFQHPIRLESDLFQPLEETFNEMAERLEKRIQFLSNDRLKILSILSDMVEGVLVLDADGRIVLVNASLEKIFGVSRKDLIGGFHYEKLRHHELNALVEAVIKTGQPRAREIDLTLPQKQSLEVQASVAQPFEKGSVVLVFHNITEKKRQEDIQKDFVANISHELRTPVSIIKGYLETLLEGGMEDRQQTKTFLEILRKNSTRMEHIIEDLLQLSRIESGLDPVRPVPIRLKEHIEKNVLLFKPLSQKKNQHLTVSIPNDLKIFADPEKLNHVITNLLDNAIKYTPESGEIRVRAVEKTGTVRIQVKDNGIGIPDRDLLRVFERFYRVDRTRSRELGGTGLGLSIVKQIVEAHDGTVSLSSQPSKGTQIELTFPNLSKESTSSIQ